MLLGAGEGEAGGTPLWAVIAIALVPLVIALITGRQATRAQKALQSVEVERERLRVLEQRVADRKRETYEPILRLMSDMLDPAKVAKQNAVKTKQTLEEFALWVSVVGSDDAVAAFRNMMQSTYASAPPQVLMRLFAEFQLAARRDLGDLGTNVKPVDLIGMRINDLYTGDPGTYLAMTLPFDELCRRAGWEIPWIKVPSGPSKHLADEIESSTDLDSSSRVSFGPLRNLRQSVSRRWRRANREEGVTVPLPD